MSLARILAEYAINTPADDVTDSALAACRKLVLDTVGCSIAAWNAPGVPESHRQMTDWGGAPEATVLVYGSKLPGPHAAFLNSIMAHALDYDDLNDPAALQVAMAQYELGLSLWVLGMRQHSKELLERALNAHRRTPGVWTRRRFPAEWARVHASLGSLQRALGSEGEGRERYEASVFQTEGCGFESCLGDRRCDPRQGPCFGSFRNRPIVQYRRYPGSSCARLASSGSWHNETVRADDGIGLGTSQLSRRAAGRSRT